jgi:hypothetical protein
MVLPPAAKDGSKFGSGRFKNIVLVFPVGVAERQNVFGAFDRGILGYGSD